MSRTLTTQSAAVVAHIQFDALVFPASPSSCVCPTASHSALPYLKGEGSLYVWYGAEM